MTNRTNPQSSKFVTIEPSIPKTDSQNRFPKQIQTVKTAKAAKTAKTDPNSENRFALKNGTDCSSGFSRVNHGTIHCKNIEGAIYRVPCPVPYLK
jgi:hypothetical protein